MKQQIYRWRKLMTEQFDALWHYFKEYSRKCRIVYYNVRNT
ncbi:hypothetical protein [Flagellimonas aquimarina]|nr:hypothetical protein [Allomuricauda koreensis]